MSISTLLFYRPGIHAYMCFHAQVKVLGSPLHDLILEAFVASFTNGVLYSNITVYLCAVLPWSPLYGSNIQITEMLTLFILFRGVKQLHPDLAHPTRAPITVVPLFTLL